MNVKEPKVSVVMPVFNREKYVREAINSILNQSFTDFEFIIVDDCSTDSTVDIVNSFKDKRIKLLKRSENMGNYWARNEGMDIATGKYICVMDSDDIAISHRIQKQYDFMELNTHYGICGSYVKVIDSDEIITAPKDYEEIKVWSMSNIMFRHPTIFIRNEFLKMHNLRYDDGYRCASDYDFLVKAAHLFPVTNIPEVLLEYRKHPDQISNANSDEQGKISNMVKLKQLSFFKKDISDTERQFHLTLMNRFPIRNENDFEQLQVWANFLLDKNYQMGYYHPAYLSSFFKSLLKYIFIQYKISKNEINNLCFSQD